MVGLNGNVGEDGNNVGDVVTDGVSDVLADVNIVGWLILALAA